MINGFTGSYRFLSNFWPAKVWLGSDVYASVEHAYQAAKTTDPYQRKLIRNAATPAIAKRTARSIQLRPNWDAIKIDVMRKLLEQKFLNQELRNRLLATDDHQLVELNGWGDRFWGVDMQGHGHNHLGVLLMEIRDSLRDSPKGRVA